MKSRRSSFIVTLDVPPGASNADLKDYILDAVITMRGSRNPYDDPIFELDGESIQVKSYRKPRK